MDILSPRQVHLDFHTSEHIPCIAENFDPVSFAKTVKDAYITSMTVFARCHHGWLYYPSKKFPHRVHPNLVNKNLLIEQVSALHNQGIKAPVYITVQWDYQLATTRPEWLIRNRDGSHLGSAFNEPGFYQSLCVNTDYYEYLEAQTIEVCEMLGDQLDGLFFDIVGIRPCLCANCRAEMDKLGIDNADDDAVREFAKTINTRFKRKLSAVVRSYKTDCSIFYNAGHIGPCTKETVDCYSHFELESLASGSWGYLHFPVSAHYARTLGKNCLGMTGKFHTSWADFHSLKNLAALEFECFRMLSYGFSSSIGDQLEPNGVLNPATYKLIGAVYKQCAEREQWAIPSAPVTEVAVLTLESDKREQAIPKGVMGAAQMLEELAVQFDIVDRYSEFDKYKLLIIPDGFVATEEFHEKLNSYVNNGGKIIACADGCLCNGHYPSCYGAEFVGANSLYPDFIVADGVLSTGLELGNEYVIYNQGVTIKPTSATGIMGARAPYFNRDGNKFCSHLYTPSAKGEPYPTVFKNGNVILFAHPIFVQYRDNAPHWCKQLIANALELLQTQLVKHNGPSTLCVSLLDQPLHSRYTLHVLSYIPVRKSATIDIIEDRTIVNDVTFKLCLPNSPKSARLVPENIPLEIIDSCITIPKINGYSIVEINY